MSTCTCVDLLLRVLVPFRDRWCCTQALILASPPERSMKRRKPAHLPLVSLSRVAELASASHGEVPEERTVRPGQEGRDPEAPCRQKWAKRHDAPVINYSRGASKWKAGHVFTEEEKRSALDAYERDFVARPRLLCYPHLGIHAHFVVRRGAASLAIDAGKNTCCRLHHEGEGLQVLR